MLFIYRQNRLFFNLTFLFAFIGAIILLISSKGELALWTNGHANSWLNHFFSWATYLGDGVVISLIILLLFIWKVYYGIVSAISFAFTSLVTQMLKHYVFYDYPRPSSFFDPALYKLKFVEGVQILHSFSFPSGHSSGSFTIFLLISLFSKNKAVQAICFLLALMAAFSRVYLLQHFFMDIYAGSLLGVFLTALLYYFFETRSGWPEKRWMNASLTDYLSKKQKAL